MKVQSLRGTRDFYPEDMRLFNHIVKIWHKIAQRFGYQEIEGPLLEPIELWTLKSGDEIPDQMYRFKDKGGREIAIRPEMTPTIARMVAQKQKELPKPIKWYAISRCWRYEAPQKGRLREFIQLNIDCLGPPSMYDDAEVIATGIEILKNLGLTSKHFFVRFNNRKLLSTLFLNTGIQKKQLQEVNRLIDKKCKLHKGDFEKALKDLKTSDKQIKEIQKILKYKTLKEIDYDTLDDKGKEGYNELKELIKHLKEMGYKNYLKLDFTIMRGFDYYTSTVFEIFDTAYKLRAIMGGGRYENLIEDFGGEPTPGIGYGVSDVTIENLLREVRKLPKLKHEIEYYIAPINKKIMPKALKIATILRKKYEVEIDLMGRNLRKQLNYANTIGAQKVIIVGPKDLEKKKVTIRDMHSGKESKITLEKLKKL